MSSEPVSKRAAGIENLGKGLVKRKQKREIGVFIDGTGLDRATRRLRKEGTQSRIDLPSLVKGVTNGVEPVTARYYTLIPNEDDSRQRAFLDAVRRSGLEVIVKRLPPVGVTRQVNVEVEMSSDIIAFALGKDKEDGAEEKSNIQKIVTVVCPGRDLSYPFSLLSSLEIETVCVDFGQPAGKELVQSATKCLDLSESETIWL